jgi:hypothetical protein
MDGKGGEKSLEEVSGEFQGLVNEQGRLNRKFLWVYEGNDAPESEFRIEQSEQEKMDFREQLSKQIEFLTTSCKAYDAGSKNEGVRIATVLRVLFHNKGISTSLLAHLQSEPVKLHYTCEPKPAVDCIWANQTNISI